MRFLVIVFLTMLLCVGMGTGVNAESTDQNIDVEKGKCFTIHLNEDYKFWYTWFPNYDLNHLKLVQEWIEPRSNGITHHFTFKALKQDLSTIKFEYRQTWRNNILNTQFYYVNITPPQMNPPQMVRTAIEAYDVFGGVFNDYHGNLCTFRRGTYRLRARLMVVDTYRPLDLRWINFHVYKRNTDGSNGELVLRNKKLTDPTSGMMTGIEGGLNGMATSNKYTFTPGEYNVAVYYEGNSRNHLSSCYKILRFKVI